MKSLFPTCFWPFLFYTLAVHADQSPWPMFMEQGSDWPIAAQVLG
jgi:hypothetical protein